MMRNKFVQQPYEDFMRNFVPGDESKRDWRAVFSPVSNVSEELLQEQFVQRLNFCQVSGEEYQAVSTQFKYDPSDPSKQKVDCGLYLKEDAPTDGRTKWSTQRLFIEFKKDSNTGDPFNDKKAALGHFEATSQKGIYNRGQLISYASDLFLRQQRLHAFSVIILGFCARIIRWDRSGAIVTEKFNYVEEPGKLGEFFHRFSQLSNIDQGYDPTATLVKEDDADFERMQSAAKKKLEENDYIREYFQKSLCEGWPCWRVTVEDEPDDPTAEQSTSNTPKKGTTSKRHFLIAKPHFYERPVVGRGTRGYVAYDKTSKEFVFLKDTWRVDGDGITKEGAILRELARKKVRNIPTVVCHGDVQGQGQETVNQAHWKPPRPRHRRGLAESVNPLKRHHHYRLVEKEVGRPLDDFENGRELLVLILDCIHAHQDAVEKANLLHRDISAGNILIWQRKNSKGKLVRRGLLNDWELSKKIPKVIADGSTTSGPRQPDRTGTWHFMSAASLNDKFKLMGIQDDLESFFHVVLWYSVIYLPSNCDNVGSFISQFFEAAQHDLQIDVVGDNGTRTRHPLDFVLSKLLSWFSAYYRHTWPNTAWTAFNPSLQEYSDEDDDLADHFSDAEDGSSGDDIDDLNPLQSKEKDAKLAAYLKNHTLAGSKRSSGVFDDDNVPVPDSDIVDEFEESDAESSPGPPNKRQRSDHAAGVNSRYANSRTAPVASTSHANPHTSRRSGLRSRRGA
ncbi:hypothetical protein B0H21DRAFT_739347 [Amylocystis lapponica]|nr:hypothetical protein B0H21DRAFT_739347 [Amylocystis lapponica]